MFSETYTIKIMIDNQLWLVKDYTTYQAILSDFPIFETTENVRTCKRMLKKKRNTKNKKKYQHIQVAKKTVPIDLNRFEIDYFELDRKVN
jgi:hypothetical protein